MMLLGTGMTAAITQAVLEDQGTPCTESLHSGGPGDSRSSGTTPDPGVETTAASVGRPLGPLEESLLDEATRSPGAYSDIHAPTPPLCEDMKAVMQYVVGKMVCNAPPGLEQAGAWYGCVLRHSRRRTKVTRIETDMACAP